MAHNSEAEHHAQPFKVTFCWPQVSGYMAACWRALADRRDVKPFIIGKSAQFNTNSLAPFNDDIMRGIPSLLLSGAEYESADRVAGAVLASEPHVVVVPGWYSRTMRRVASSLRGTPLLLAMDNPQRGWSYSVAIRWRYRRFLAQMSGAVVPGYRGEALARSLGFPPRYVYQGLYGVDHDLWKGALKQRLVSTWPRRFLFIGRYLERKGVPDLLSAYNAYRSSVEDPWPLTMCGRGPLEDLVGGRGVCDVGFLQPRELFSLVAEHGVFVLPSRYDPWPLAVVEASASGLPVICSDACGSAVEVVRDSYSGWVTPAGDIERLAATMQMAHERYADLARMGARASTLAEAYSASTWAERWAQIVAGVV